MSVAGMLSNVAPTSAGKSSNRIHEAITTEPMR